jgi:hypothetical protein
MKRREQIRSRLVYGLALAILLAAGACQSLAQAPTSPAIPDSADNLTGTLLFINGRPQAALPVPVAELRSTCISRLEAALRAKGHLTADRQLMESLVQKWRIRRSRLVPRDFLVELDKEHGVGQVLVVTLLSDNARFLMTARMIDTRTGRLTRVELGDVDLPEPDTEGSADWRMILDGLCLAITPAWAPPPPAALEPVLVLPMRGIASDPEITSAAGHSLLKTLLAQGATLIDPALVEVAMLEAGLPSHWLDARGRRLLLDRFACPIVLVSELVSYDPGNPSGSRSIFDEDGLGGRRRTLSVFSMSLRAVSLETGTAVRSAQVMHEKLPPTGWFGNRIQTTLLQELETTSLELWAAYSPEAEDD